MRPSLVIPLLLLTACPSDPGDLPRPDFSVPADGGAADLTARRPLAVLGLSDFTSGALASLDLGSRAVEKKLDTIDPQAVVRAYDQSHGVLRVYDPARQWKDPVEISTGNNQLPAAQSNPHDVYVDAAAQRAYVTLYGSFGSSAVTGERALGMIDLRNPGLGISAFVPLQVAAADMDGNPDADRLLACGGRLYVTLQDLDRNNMYKPSGPARLAALDPAQPATVEYVPLAGQNPSAFVAPGGGCAEALVGHGDDQLSGMPAGKGGIERVDLPGRRSLGLLLSDVQLGGNVSALDSLDGRRAFVDLVSKRGMGFQHEVFIVDLVAKQKGARVLGPLNYVPALRAFGEELLVLSAGFPAAGQLRVGLYVGRGDGSLLPEQPLELGLPPISFDLLQL
jgi:hypothetical protein